MRRCRIIAAVPTAALLALTACTTNSDNAAPLNIDDATRIACDTFSSSHKGAHTPQARTELVNKVKVWARQSIANGLPAAAVVLVRDADGSARAWRQAAGDFIHACTQAGWKAT
ncbi:hypothetical protein [Actinacidiphila glaucinigra]|uniref:hypothetical protein n=1 Tax=Actinacidiphila glaucinigra TaxID=235986 RepID=UPI0035D73B7F